MISKFDMLDPDDYAFTHYFAKIQKRFPSLRWDDVVRKGLEEWMLLAKKDEEAENDLAIQGLLPCSRRCP